MGWYVRRLLVGRVSGEPGLLVFDQVGGLLADVADGFEGELAGEVVDRVFGRRLDVGGPALGGVEKLGEDFADVFVVGAVVIEVVVELVGDVGELLEEVVGILLRGRACGDGRRGPGSSCCARRGA